MACTYWLSLRRGGLHQIYTFDLGTRGLHVQGFGGHLGASQAALQSFWQILTPVNVDRSRSSLIRLAGGVLAATCGVYTRAPDTQEATRYPLAGACRCNVTLSLHFLLVGSEKGVLNTRVTSV